MLRHHLINRSISGAVVRGAVMTDPVCHGLYQDRLVLAGSDLPGCLGGVIHSQDVIPVNPDGCHPVGRASHSDTWSE